MANQSCGYSATLVVGGRRLVLDCLMLWSVVDDRRRLTRHCYLLSLAARLFKRGGEPGLGLLNAVLLPIQRNNCGLCLVCLVLDEEGRWPAVEGCLASCSVVGRTDRVLNDEEGRSQNRARNPTPTKLTIKMKPRSLGESSRSPPETPTPSMDDVVGVPEPSPYREEEVVPLCPMSSIDENPFQSTMHIVGCLTIQQLFSQTELHFKPPKPFERPETIRSGFNDRTHFKMMLACMDNGIRIRPEGRAFLPCGGGKKKGGEKRDHCGSIDHERKDHRGPADRQRRDHHGANDLCPDPRGNESVREKEVAIDRLRKI
ncbi:hypothetical protein Dimus_001226 [Dionaea muscipula]